MPITNSTKNYVDQEKITISASFFCFRMSACIRMASFQALGP